MAYLIDLLESIKDNSFSDETFYPQVKEWEPAVSWAKKYSARDLSNKEIVDLLYYFYVRENLDYYPVEQFKKAASFLSEQFDVRVEDVLQMLIDFRSMVFVDA